eukprot:COSAG04_NODE_1458_length_6631_cov_10.649878_3_plen_76_part_00
MDEKTSAGMQTDNIGTATERTVRPWEWQSGYNPRAAGSTPRPPSEPRRLAPVALRRVWAPSEAEESPGGHKICLH